MKKIITLFLSLAFIAGYSQNIKPRQIYPGEENRLFMVSDTLTEEGEVFREMGLYSIDSMVRQIAVDSLGLDSTYWRLDDSLSLSPINQTNNIILGNLSGNRSMSGSYNFIGGNGLGSDLTTGSYNTIFGSNNLISINTSSFAFASGANNGVYSANTQGSFFNGVNNGATATGALQYNFFNGNENLRFGTGATSYMFANGYRNASNANVANYSLFNGHSNFYSGTGDLSYNFAVGFQNAYNTSGSFNQYNFIFGNQNLYNANDIDHNFISGFRNIYQSTSNIINTIAIGRENGYSATGDHSNSIYLGYRNAYNGSGNYNNYQGYESGYYQTGNYNIGFGYRALYGQSGLSTGSFNVALGEQSLKNNTTGNNNVGQGAGSLFNNTTGNNNLGLGYRSFYTNSTGTGNVGIGRESGYLNTGNYNVFIGYQSGYNETGSNKLYIENSNISTPLIYGEFDNDLVRINGSLEVSDKAGTAGNFAAFDGDKIVDSGVSTLGDPDQTLSFNAATDELTISGSGGNTVDISGVNYWGLNGNDVFLPNTFNVGIGTIIPEAASVLHVEGQMYLNGVVKDGNGNVAGGAGRIMTSNSGGEFLWESPGNIGLASFNNNAGFITGEVDGSTTNELQNLSLSASTLSITSGNSVNLPMYDAGSYVRPSTNTDGIWVPDGLLDKDLQYGSSGQVLSSTGAEEVDWITLPSSPWTEISSSRIYFNTASSDQVGINNTNPSYNLDVTGTARITSDLTTSGSLIMTGTGEILDFPSSGNIRDAGGTLGTSGDILSHNGIGVDWVDSKIELDPGIGALQLQGVDATSSTGLSLIDFTHGIISDGITPDVIADEIYIPTGGSGWYRVTFDGTVWNSTTTMDLGLYVNGSLTSAYDTWIAGANTVVSFSRIYYFNSGDDIGVAFASNSGGTSVTISAATLTVEFIKY